MGDKYPERIICHYEEAGSDQKKKGPIVVAVGGLHGNELAGVKAIQKVSEQLEQFKGSLHGTFIGIRGNRRAVHEGVRFLDEDLNRAWLPERICFDSGTILDQRDTYEEGELEALARFFLDIKRDADEDQDIWLIDLHTTSAPTVPFLWALPQQDDQAILDYLPIPAVYDGIPRIQGTLAGYATALGFRALCPEGGAHGAPDSVEALHAIIWILMNQIGMFEGGNESVLMKDEMDYLTEATGDIPKALRIFCHHMITPEDEFRMEGGYLNFQKVEKGELLAHDRNGPIHAIDGGRILMPLYQSIGEDGFLLVRKGSR